MAFLLHNPKTRWDSYKAINYVGWVNHKILQREQNMATLQVRVSKIDGQQRNNKQVKLS